MVTLNSQRRGNYINGTWSATSIAPFPTKRFSYASEILPSGKVWVIGGENYGPGEDYTWTATGLIYDPIANTWSPIETFPPQACFNVTYNVTSNTSSGSTVITNLPTTVTPTFLPGWTLAGNGIPAGATIISVDKRSCRLFRCLRGGQRLGGTRTSLYFE